MAFPPVLPDPRADTRPGGVRAFLVNRTPRGSSSRRDRGSSQRRDRRHRICHLTGPISRQTRPGSERPAPMLVPGLCAPPWAHSRMLLLIRLRSRPTIVFVTHTGESSLEYGDSGPDHDNHRQSFDAAFLRMIPLLDTIRHYDRTWLAPDLAAAVTSIRARRGWGRSSRASRGASDRMMSDRPTATILSPLAVPPPVPGHRR